MEVRNVKNSMKAKDGTAKECYMSCYNSNHSVLTAELVFQTSHLMKRGPRSETVCRIIQNPDNYPIAVLTYTSQVYIYRRYYFQIWATAEKSTTGRSLTCGFLWRRVLREAVKCCVQANSMRMMVGMTGSLDTIRPEQCNPDRFAVE